MTTIADESNENIPLLKITCTCVHNYHTGNDLSQSNLKGKGLLSLLQGKKEMRPRYNSWQKNNPLCSTLIYTLCTMKGKPFIIIFLCPLDSPMADIQMDCVMDLLVLVGVAAYHISPVQLTMLMFTKLLAQETVEAMAYKYGTQLCFCGW